MYQRYESSLGPEHCTSSECVDPSLSMPSAEKYTDWNAAYQQSLSSVIQPSTHIYRAHRCVLSPNQPSTSTNPTTFSMQHPKYLNVPPTPNLDRPNPMPFSDGSTHLQSHRPYHRSPPAIYPPHHPPPTRHPPLYTSLPLLPKTHMKRSSHNASRKEKKKTPQQGCTGLFHPTCVPCIYIVEPCTSPIENYAQVYVPRERQGVCTQEVGKIRQGKDGDAWDLYIYVVGGLFHA